MADYAERTTYVFEVKGGPESKREITGIADAFNTSQKSADRLATSLTNARKYLNFAEGVKTASDFAAKMKEFPQLMTKLEAELRKVTDSGLKGLGKGFNELTKDEQNNIATLRGFNAEYKRTHGLSASVSAGIETVAARFAQFFSVVGLTTAAIGLIQKLATAVKNLADESLRLGREEELSEARLIAVTGSVSKGKEAWALYDKTLKNTAASMKSFSEKDYTAAVARGGIHMGKAYLDASVAMEATGRDANALITQLIRLEAGIGIQKRGMAKYSDVVKEAGLDLNALVKNEYDATEASGRLRDALARMSESQENITGKTAIGTMNQVKNLWTEIKENAGRMLNEVLKPIGEAILSVFKDSNDWSATLRFLKEMILPVIKLTVFDIVVAIKEIHIAAVMVNGALTVMYELADKVGRKFTDIANFMLDPFGILGGPIIKGKKGAKQRGDEAPLTGPQSYLEEEEPEKTSEHVMITRGDYIETSPGVWERIDSYNARTGKGTKTGGGGGPGRAMTEEEKEARQLGMTLDQYRTAQAGPMVAEKIYPTEDYRGGQLKVERELAAYDKAAASRKGLKETARDAGRYMGEMFDAIVHKGFGSWLKQEAYKFAMTIITTLAASAIFSVLKTGTQGVGGGGLWGFLLGGGKGFQEEGSFKNLTAPAPILIHPDELVLQRDTLQAIRAGRSPRGGRAGFEYGPEDYGVAPATVVNLTAVVNPLANAELTIFRESEKGRAIAEGLDA